MIWKYRVLTVAMACVAWLCVSCVGATGDSGYYNPPPAGQDASSNPAGVTCNNSGANTLVCEGEAGPSGNTEYCPFTGHTNSLGNDFTCTTCPQGIDWLSGTWMFFQNVPGDAPFLDVLTVEGNHFTETIIGEDKILSPGKETTAILKGYYFCPSKAEYTSLRKIFVIESVEPEDGLFGNHAGDSYPCDVLGNGAASSFLLWCDYGWTGSPPLNTQYEYCRKGSQIEGANCVIPAL